MRLEKFVENRFKDNEEVSKETYALYKFMASVIDREGEKGTALTPKEATELTIRKYGKEVETLGIGNSAGGISKTVWEDFIYDKAISAHLNAMTIMFNKVIARKKFASLKEDGTIKKTEFDAMMCLLEESKSSAKGSKEVSYVQYMVPPRFSEDSSKELVEKFEKKEENFE